MKKPDKNSYRKISTARANIAKPSTRSAPRADSFNPDYSYVIKDLKRIGILAGSFIAILVILSFFL